MPRDVLFPQIISYLKKLKPEDWQRKVNKKWTVKDVVAHLVAWERDDIQVIKTSWANKKIPWFYKTTDYDSFNEKAVKYYKKYSGARLVKEWEKWRKKVEIEITRIGENKLRQHPKLFRWLFDQDNYNSHYNHHYRQIQKAVKSKN